MLVLTGYRLPAPAILTPQGDFGLSDETNPITPPRKVGPRTYSCIVDHQRRPYSVSWSGSTEYPDFKASPANYHVDVLPQSPGMATIWESSTLLDFGSHASIRTSCSPGNKKPVHNDDDCFPIIKLAHSDAESLALIQTEINILSDSLMRDVPTVTMDSRPITDNGVAVGYRMQRLYKLDSLGFQSRSLDIKNALQRLHDAGFCHGDLSPSNVMKDRYSCITLIDFSHAGRVGETVPLHIKKEGYDGDVFSTDYDWKVFHSFIQ